MFTIRNIWDWKRSYCLDCTSIDWSTARYLHHCPNSAGNKVALSSSTLKSTRTSCRDLNKKLFYSSGELMELDNNFCWWRKSVNHANQPKGGLSHYLEGFVHPLCMTAYIKNIVCSPMYVFQSVFPPYTNLVQDFVYQLVSKKPLPSLHLQLRCQNHSQGPQIFCCLKCSSKHWNLGKIHPVFRGNRHCLDDQIIKMDTCESCRNFHTSSRITKFWIYVRSPECSYIFRYIYIYSRPSRGFIVDDFERGAKQLGCTVGITVG